MAAINLRHSFELQAFANNKKLQAVINDTLSRYPVSRTQLSDDDVEQLSAAGARFIPGQQKQEN